MGDNRHIYMASGKLDSHHNPLNYRRRCHPSHHFHQSQAEKLIDEKSLPH
jgi:hypothetical protein